MTNMSLLERFFYSIVVMLIGLFVVFLGLIILIGCIKLMSKLIGWMRSRQEAKKEVAPVAQPEPVVAEAAAEPEQDEGELIAVITAALMAYQKSTGGKQLVVRNIRRQNAWAAAGRSEQLNRF